MITVRTSPAYVNRVRESWEQGGGVSTSAPTDDPFAQLGPTLDLVFAGVVSDLPNTGSSLDLNFVSQTYQIGAPYAVWATPPSVNYELMPTALLNAALNVEPEKTLFKDTLIGGRPLGDINNSGTVTSADSLAYDRFNVSFWLNAAGLDDYIRNVLNPYMIANPVTYSAYLLF